MASNYLRSSDRHPFSKSRTLAVDYTKSLKKSPTDPAYHPPRIGDIVDNLLSGSFGCNFEPASKFDIHASTPLPFYIESLLSATKLPFQVTVAALTLLQRLYIRLPPEVFESRRRFSPHQLFTAAYICAGKQYTQVRLGLDFTRSLFTHTPEGATLERDGVTVAILMSDVYWSKRTSYSVQEIRTMQRQLQVALGGSVAVFAVMNPVSRELLKQIKSFLPRRRLPAFMQLDSKPKGECADLQNLGHLRVAEQMEYFQKLGGKLSSTQSTTKKKA